MAIQSRREFIRKAGISAAALPFICGLPSLGNAAEANQRKQRMIVMFSPNGTIPDAFWPDKTGEDFELKPIMQPLAEYKDRMLILKGVSNKVRGDGDSHMRGMSCLLSGKELFPGNIQGGSHTPAGWCSGISIDQELKNFFQSNTETETRFGSLEFGVQVGDRADPWTRMSYAGPNKPVAPIDDPYQMFKKLYGNMQDRETLKSVLDDLTGDFQALQSYVSVEDRRLLEQHVEAVRELEQELKRPANEELTVPAPELPAGVRDVNDNMPQLSKMHIDMLVNSFTNDLARVATLQYTKSVGGARMNWLGIKESHHGLSHDPDMNAESKEKLVKINIWFAEQMAYLVKRLAETPEPGGDGTLLDNTVVVWTNELGKGNSHTLDNIPWLLVGNGMDFKMGQSLNLKGAAHNRLLLAFAHSMGHQIETFGNPKLCKGGALEL